MALKMSKYFKVTLQNMYSNFECYHQIDINCFILYTYITQSTKIENLIRKSLRKTTRTTLLKKAEFPNENIDYGSQSILEQITTKYA